LTEEGSWKRGDILELGKCPRVEEGAEAIETDGIPDSHRIWGAEEGQGIHPEAVRWGGTPPRGVAMSHRHQGCRGMAQVLVGWKQAVGSKNSNPTPLGSLNGLKRFAACGGPHSRGRGTRTSRPRKPPGSSHQAGMAAALVGSESDTSGTGTASRSCK